MATLTFSQVDGNTGTESITKVETTEQFHGGQTPADVVPDDANNATPLDAGEFQDPNGGTGSPNKGNSPGGGIFDALAHIGDDVKNAVGQVSTVVVVGVAVAIGAAILVYVVLPGLARR